MKGKCQCDFDASKPGLKQLVIQVQVLLLIQDLDQETGVERIKRAST